MPIRFALVLTAASLVGCISPRIAVNPPADKSTASKPVARFGELVSRPGDVVRKSPTPQPAPPDAIFPVKTEEHAEPITTHLAPLLSPAPAPDPPLVLALRDTLEGRADKAAERLAGLGASHRQIASHLLTALVQTSQNTGPLEASLLTKHIDAASEIAGRLAPLKIRKACLVWRVDQFGVYEPVPDSHVFLPGGTGLLYLELANAPSVATELPAGGSGYVTRLECSHVLSVDGQPVAGNKSAPHAEYTRSPVRDYFLKIEFAVPQTPGRYILAVELTDPATQRKAREQVEVKVGN